MTTLRLTLLTHSTLLVALGASACGGTTIDPAGDAGSDSGLVNECAAASSPCGANATCTDLPTGFDCTCSTGYEGDGHSCINANECLYGTDNCSDHATCADTVGAFTCTCVGGYSGDGVTCTNVDECTLTTDNCSANGTCTDTVGAFTCACSLGYAGDGVTCTPDECYQSTDNCSVNATCADTPSAFTCTCNGSYVGNGRTCYTVTATTVIDPINGWEWQRDPAPGTYNWADAATYCNNLVLNGQSDWHLPTKIVLKEIADVSLTPPPVIDMVAFPSSEIGFFWTSTTGPTFGDSVGVYLGTGADWETPQTDLNKVRCVR